MAKHNAKQEMHTKIKHLIKPASNRQCTRKPKTQRKTGSAHENQKRPGGDFTVPRRVAGGINVFHLLHPYIKPGTQSIASLCPMRQLPPDSIITTNINRSTKICEKMIRTLSTFRIRFQDFNTSTTTGFFPVSSLLLSSGPLIAA